MSKETIIDQKATYIPQKDLHSLEKVKQDYTYPKESCIHQKRPAFTNRYQKRSIFIKDRPVFIKRDRYSSLNVQRDLYSSCVSQREDRYVQRDQYTSEDTSRETVKETLREGLKENSKIDVKRTQFTSKE
jgi:hypothetical protein